MTEAAVLPSTERVCVIIAAYNASATIAAAIQSALIEPEVAEVVVVDDASGDDTADVARAADDGTGRLQVIRLEQNGGPSRARNAAIKASTAPWLAILDADDTLLPGRFARLFAQTGWELAADNIVLVPAERQVEAGALPIPDFAPEPRQMPLCEFIEGNVTSGKMHRNETGLLKPVISRAFLEQAGLAYEDHIRLGEDFILYTRLMARGARFITIRSCGYRAIQRRDSLSVRHRTADLGNLAEASRAILAEEKLDPAARAALIRQERLTRGKYRLRAFLDLKAQGGMAKALRYALQSPGQFYQIARGVAHDKWQALKLRLGASTTPVHAAPPVMRFLMEGQPR